MQRFLKFFPELLLARQDRIQAQGGRVQGVQHLQGRLNHSNRQQWVLQEAEQLHPGQEQQLQQEELAKVSGA